MNNKSFDIPPHSEIEQEERDHDFSQLLSNFEFNREKNDGYIEYNLPYPKEQFLEYLVQKKNFLLHGSGEILSIITPQQANDAAKLFGNKKAVYAVTDSVFPIFFAIKDRTKINGVVTSSREINDGEIRYYFAMPKQALAQYPYKSGVVYILKKDGFNEEFNDDGDPSNEWTSENPVKPWAKLKVNPEDFRFLNEVIASD